ncbi:MULTISPECIES: bifunctional 2-polyprenyl-6-hydroxyphenol methylase/3-demethylubiquinol 3-O-methyltransferase UbiG [unclassified Streptomyces]|uniref:class I SAM-dependent methyltransferase n=1 Tax=unclassified Streptomyces TaxID=2593676 RepID=UPI00069BE03A|nr:SAM-dependent methyltransferase [Streptomyces sp. CNQ-509]
MHARTDETADGPVHGDAFGMQLADSVRHARPVTAFVERSDGLIIPSGSAQWLDEEGDWPPEVCALLGRARGRVLDAGAGAGRHAVHLARKNHDVTALDNSPLALGLCERRGVARIVLGELASVAALFRGTPPFATVLLLGNNVGLLGSEAMGAGILRQLHAITADDAVILAEGRRPVDGTVENAAYVERNRMLGRLPGELRMRIRYRTTATDWFPYLFCTPSELAAIASAAHWTMAEVTAFRYPHDSPRHAPLSYTAVLRKSAQDGTAAGPAVP